MPLVIDIGNTNIVVGIYENDVLKFTERLGTDKNKNFLEYADDFFRLSARHNTDSMSVESAVAASVVPEINDTIYNAVKEVFHIETVFVSHSINTGLNICTRKPEKTGADLICGAAAAAIKYKPPFILFDLGTATTVCAVDEKNNYLGHSITPGVDVSFGSLARQTAQLPDLTGCDSCDEVIGSDTESAIRSGVMLGAACFIDGMTRRYKKILGENALVIATGGLSGTIISYCETDIIYDADLILYGLNELSKMNSCVCKEDCPH
ncbi:MAG: type III pantothenate kinase [Oscillospiraceae bacterium]|nr:type III pantothenate kinase [Oscillospiraceae bacterium]